MAERIFRGFLFLSRRIFSRIFSPDFFSSFSWEKVLRKILQENPLENLSKIYTTKIPDTFLQRGRANIWEAQISQATTELTPADAQRIF